MPIGCVFVFNGDVVASGRNYVNKKKNATRHAELEAIDELVDKVCASPWFFYVLLSTDRLAIDGAAPGGGVAPTAGAVCDLRAMYHVCIGTAAAGLPARVFWLPE